MKGNVLIIEDERELGELIQLFLSNEGITSALAGTAEEGISRIAREDYDLVILDLNLPGMDGFEFLQQFRRNQTIPVIIVSAKTADEDIISGLGIGADEFATKPFKPRVLTARVRALLRRSSHYSDGKRKIFNFGEFELDYDGFLLKKGGRAVGLSTREMEVLRFLIINAGNIYTPQEIFTAVWEQEFGEFTTVAVYIQRLRKKLEQDYRQPVYLKTIHGRGYRFEKELLS